MQFERPALKRQLHGGILVIIALLAVLAPWLKPAAVWAAEEDVLAAAWLSVSFSEAKGAPPFQIGDSSPALDFQAEVAPCVGFDCDVGMPLGQLSWCIPPWCTPVRPPCVYPYPCPVPPICPDPVCPTCNFNETGVGLAPALPTLIGDRVNGLILNNGVEHHELRKAPRTFQRDRQP